MAEREIRFQGAVVSDHCMLMLLYRPPRGAPFWLIPGGGRESEETDQECVAREILEETHLTVRVERQILEVDAPPDGVYLRLRTYLCTPVSGSARPGYEPEDDAADVGEIAAVRWFVLRDEGSWPGDVKEDPISLSQLRGIRRALGYDGGGYA